MLDSDSRYLHVLNMVMKTFFVQLTRYFCAYFTGLMVESQGSDFV